jgi:hypothetical protein
MINNFRNPTYHISTSPSYSEDIHTDYPWVSLKGVMTQVSDNLGYNYEYLNLGSNFSIQSLVENQTRANLEFKSYDKIWDHLPGDKLIINHPHEY